MTPKLQFCSWNWKIVTTVLLVIVFPLTLHFYLFPWSLLFSFTRSNVLFSFSLSLCLLVHCLSICLCLLLPLFPSTCASPSLSLSLTLSPHFLTLFLSFFLILQGGWWAPRFSPPESIGDHSGRPRPWRWVSDRGSCAPQVPHCNRLSYNGRYKASFHLDS